jgi:polysaccharide biosynthesis protein PslH
MSSSNTPLKILLLTHRVPYPPDKGDRIRSYHLLRHLARRHKVSLAALSEEPVGEAAVGALSDLCERVAVVPQGRSRWVRGALALLTGRPLTEGLFRDPRLRKILSEWTAKEPFDVVIGFCSSMAQYLVAPPLDKLPAVVDLVDVDSEKWREYARNTRGWRRWLYGLEARRLRRFEARLTDRCSAVTVVSEREAAAYRAFQPAGHVAAIRNGVDLEFFSDRTAQGTLEPEPLGARPPEAEPSSCVFVGALDYLPNVEGIRWFCEDVWPGVRAAHPDATVTLVGRNPVRSVRRLGALPGVKVVGGVPDVRPYLQAARVAIAPLRIARGVQNKVLEAMALGRPVVVSPQAAEGLPRSVAAAATVAGTPRDWAEQIERMLQDPLLARRRGAAGRAAVEADCRWDRCLEPWEGLLREAVERRRQAEPSRGRYKAFPPYHSPHAVPACTAREPIRAHTL